MCLLSVNSSSVLAEVSSHRTISASALADHHQINVSGSACLHVHAWLLRHALLFALGQMQPLNTQRGAGLPYLYAVNACCVSAGCSGCKCLPYHWLDHFACHTQTEPAGVSLIQAERGRAGQGRAVSELMQRLEPTALPAQVMYSSATTTMLFMMWTRATHCAV